MPTVENPRADLDGPAPGHPFDEALRAALRGKLAALPALIFMHSFHEVYDAQRTGPIQIRKRGAFVALGPIHGDFHSAIVGVMFYGGYRWVRWLRYHLERADDMWQIARREVLAVS